MKILRRSILEELTLTNIYSNYSVGQLIEKIIHRDEAKLTSTGAVRATTGKYTGRSPKDKFIVKDALSADKVDWGNVNQPIEEEVFNQLLGKVIAYLDNQEEIFHLQAYAGADEKYKLPIPGNQ